jgi:1-acyl-sn-glycerol-3-phosphate acyltransferase
MTTESLSPPSLPDPIVANAHWQGYRFLLRVFFCFWLKYRARGMEHLPTAGGALLLINHQSFVDPLLAGLPFQRPVSYLARDSLFRVPVIGWILGRTYVMPISREAASTASLREAIRRLDHGFYVGIFPEGTRTETGEVGPLKPGFLALLRRSKVPVIPVGIAGAFEAYPKGQPLPAPGKVRVVYGEAFDRTHLASFGKDREAELLAFVHDRITACHEAAAAWRAE